MKHFLEIVLGILDIIDQHEGAIAMMGIAISVLIFRKEVTNNYFTLEKDNFSDLFKDITLKQLPEKMAGVEEASENEWSEKFYELMDVLEEMLLKAKYFKYSIPYFYRCLKLTIEEIGDLERHENWRLYRNSAKQNQLIEKKCKKIIQTINDTSKGRILKIRWHQNKVINGIKNLFVKKIIDRPIDRILGTIIMKDRSGLINIYNILGKGNHKICNQELKSIETRKVLLEASNPQITIVEVRPVEVSGKYYFGYYAGIRMGKRIGKIVLKAQRDKLVRVHKNGSKVILKLEDSNMHKCVVSWKLKDDSTHIFYDVIKVRYKQNYI